jgi:hypothetical protein
MINKITYWVLRYILKLNYLSIFIFFCLSLLSKKYNIIEILKFEFRTKHNRPCCGLHVKCPPKVWSPVQPCSEVGPLGGDWIMRALTLGVG